jgi:hypothetical protein
MEKQMLTIVAWIVFVPAVVWNALFFGYALIDLMGKGQTNWRLRRNWRDLAISLAIMFIPGVYLFGWF